MTRPQSGTVDAAELDSLAWRAVELAVQRRHDPRLIVATRPTVIGPTSTARLIAGLCNAAAGRRVVALFGIDGTDVLGVDDPPDGSWLDTVIARFPGVVPTLTIATIDADGAHIVAITAEDPGTPVVATRAGQVVIPWFDGTLADRPPSSPVERGPVRPAGRLEIRSGWLERTGACVVDPARAGTEAGTETAASADRPSDARQSDDVRDAGADAGIVVWRGMLDIALALDTTRIVPTSDAGDAGVGADGSWTPDGPDIAIADRAVSVTLLADGSATALSLDVQIHPSPAAAPVRRTDGGVVVVDPLIPCRLYLATANGAAVFDQPGDLTGAVRLLVSLRFPGDDRLVAAMATLARDTAAACRWSV